MSNKKHIIVRDFQEATANRIVELFRGGQKRVLLSDEVGLGKTIIARAVIDRVRDLPNVQSDGIYKIVYVCSNQNIIHQNIRNLGIDDGKIEDLRSCRLSMQHLIIQEKSADKEQLIPLTPSTSFKMTSGLGNGDERALMCVVLFYLEELKNKKESVSNFFKTPYITIKENWENLLGKYKERVKKCLDSNPNYVSDMLNLLKKDDKFEELVFGILNNGNHFDILPKLRIRFAQISLSQLKPDLVIMDEFQRFSELLSATKEESEKSEETIVAHNFFQDDHPYVLLLSATPYKPFTTLEELNENNCDEQYVDFFKLMNFLFEKASNDDFSTIWKDYSAKLSHISSVDFDVLRISKNNAENKMYEAVCRTERFRCGLVKTYRIENDDMLFLEGDVLSYCQMQHLLQEAKIKLDKKKEGGGNHQSYNIPIEYVKSSPYLLSFMRHYQEVKTIKDAFGCEDKIPILKNKRTQKLLLKKSDINGYRKIVPYNAKLNALENIIFRNNAECLLWVPASNPYYEIPQNNVFYQNRDFSKILVFSAWEMVPRMLATMLSYKSEQLTIHNIYKGTTYNSKKGEQILKDAAENLLAYQSKYLADLYDCQMYFGQNINLIVQDLQEKIQKDIECLNLTINNSKGAEAILNLVKKLNGEDIDLVEIPEKASLVLAYMAIASPAICIYRIMGAENKEENKGNIDVIDVIKSIISIFNRKESSAIVKLTALKTKLKEENYYEQVLYYCVMGNLQAVLDEYCSMIDVSGDKYKMIKKLNEAFISTHTIEIKTLESYPSKESSFEIRRNFAFDYSKIQDKNANHTVTLQQAFNSPFRPFVLATTSVGQEGLDFHWYARKIVHWNLPSNPVDLEQRDGRIDRYKSLAIRRNIAKFCNMSGFKNCCWSDLFEHAATKWKQYGYSDMVPYWCLPEKYIKENEDNIEYIERIVPLYPRSYDEIRFRRLLDVLSLYRLTMGQPRQEELLYLLEGRIDEKRMEDLLFDLSPYSRNKNMD